MTAFRSEGRKMGFIKGLVKPREDLDSTRKRKLILHLNAQGHEISIKGKKTQ